MHRPESAFDVKAQARAAGIETAEATGCARGNRINLEESMSDQSNRQSRLVRMIVPKTCIATWTLTAGGSIRERRHTKPATAAKLATRPALEMGSARRGQVSALPGSAYTKTMPATGVYGSEEKHQEETGGRTRIPERGRSHPLGGRAKEGNEFHCATHVQVDGLPNC